MRRGENGIRELEKEKKKIVIEAIPYRNFKEKINITKKYYAKAKIEVYNNYIYVERVLENGF